MEAVMNSVCQSSAWLQARMTERVKAAPNLTPGGKPAAGLSAWPYAREAKTNPVVLEWLVGEVSSVLLYVCDARLPLHLSCRWQEGWSRAS